MDFSGESSGAALPHGRGVTHEDHRPPAAAEEPRLHPPLRGMTTVSTTPMSVHGGGARRSPSYTITTTVADVVSSDPAGRPTAPTTGAAAVPSSPFDAEAATTGPSPPLAQQALAVSAVTASSSPRAPPPSLLLRHSPTRRRVGDRLPTDGSAGNAAAYVEDPSETTTTTTATTMGHPQSPLPHPRVHREMEEGEWAAATEDEEGNPREGGTAAASVHCRGGSLGFTFSGQPADVMRFRSCIPPAMTRGRGGRGEATATPPPEWMGRPFPADILNVILLFIDAGDVRDILEVSRVCRFWRYYANYAPHWSAFHRRGGRSRGEERPAPYARAAVAPPKVVTREEFFVERHRAEARERRRRVFGYVKHIRWCVATAIMAGVMMTANFVVAYSLGFLRTALRSDAKLGATTAALMVVMTVLEVTVVMVPLGGVAMPANKEGMIRILCWGLVILDVGIVLGTITALAFTRVQANGHVLDGPTIDLSMDAECTMYSSKEYPSFALLPAFLWDIRWRPITTDPLRESLQPYCLTKPNDSKGETKQCYVLLYFDANYESDVFQSKAMLDKYRDVGATTALGFDPFSRSKRLQGTWCPIFESPQMVALTTAVYSDVAEQRNRNFPSDRDWLNPRFRPQTYGVISHRCSSDINREITEDPRGSTDMWFQHSSAWQQHFIPLMSTLRQLRGSFQEAHDHFLHYAFRCYIISGGVWAVQLLGQCLVKKAAIDVLGVTATLTLALLNPLSLALSGILCVALDSRDFMCSNSSGYGLMSAGVGLALLMATVFVTVSD